MKALGSFTAALFGGLCALAALAFFIFGFGEPKWGSSTNMFIAIVTFFIPATAVAALGYAASAYARDRGRTRTGERYVCLAVLGGAGAVVGFTAFMTDLLAYPWVAGGYFLALGVMAPWL